MTLPTELKNHGLLSPGEVAKETGRHRSTIWQWMEQGLLASFYIDGRGKLIPFKKGMKRPHYRGVRPEDIHPWHRAGKAVSRDRTASEAKPKPKVARKAKGKAPKKKRTTPTTTR